MSDLPKLEYSHEESPKEKKRVEIGSGLNGREGYESCDIRELPGVKNVCSADVLPYETESVDEIYSRHTIEHFTLKEFLKVLAEWNRVLKTGGEVYLVCPNVLWHFEQVLKGTHESFSLKEPGTNDRYWGYGSIFGWQQDEHDTHKFGYYFELLRDILVEAGFSEIEDLTNKPEGLEHAPWHLEVRARKIKTVSDYTASKLYSHFDKKH